MTKAERKRLCAACREMFPGQKIPLFQKALRKKRKEKQEQERLTKKEETAAIREAVFKRAAAVDPQGVPRCEAGVCWRRATEMDHWLGGWGRRRQKQSVETCWALCALCHGERQQNWPDLQHWNKAFYVHCERHDYRFTPRFGGRPQADARNEPPDSVSDASFALGAQEGEK